MLRMSLRMGLQTLRMHLRTLRMSYQRSQCLAIFLRMLRIFDDAAAIGINSAASLPLAQCSFDLPCECLRMGLQTLRMHLRMLRIEDWRSRREAFAQQWAYLRLMIMIILIIHICFQVEYVCKMIKSDKNLQDGYHAIGFSQGGLFMRALIQRCPDLPVHNYISVGGPHQGI
ncbi:Palmitoyl-protein thioesterase 1 [Nymphon striatum]|nr:Palmitoyl-protein thioesterase 1 [Nymphon striatum]